eukprot:2020248-Amphidinium_carterae.3
MVRQPTKLTSKGNQEERSSSKRTSFKGSNTFAAEACIDSRHACLLWMLLLASPFENNPNHPAGSRGKEMRLTAKTVFTTAKCVLVLR